MYKIVNLETFFVPENQKYTLLKDEIGESKDILGLMLTDGFLHETPGKIIEEISKEINLFIVAGMVSNNTTYKKIIPFNFHLHTTYHSYKDKITYNWNPNSNKFLFLGGVPNRPNRLGLLNKFRKANLLNQSIWTFFKPWTDEQEEWCRNYTSDYKEILSLCRSIDSVYESSKHYGTSPVDNEWTKDTGWINPDIFKNTIFSVISEGISNSDDLSSKYLTEKTYRVFVQRHPFIHASNPEMFNYIKELGFKTFENYMAIPNYALMLNEEDRFDAIVENTKYFLKNYNSNRKKIEKDVNFNYNKFFILVQENFKILDRIIKDFGVKQVDIDKWFNQKGFSHLIRAYKK